MRAGAQPVRAVRAASDGNFRRAYPWEARRAVSSLAIAVGVVALALLLGRALGSWIPAIVVVLGFAGEAVDLAWKQRRQRGRAQGWPPGSVRAGPDAMIVHDHFARRKAREGPVFKTMFAGSPTVCIADLDFARALFREHATDLSHAWGPIERFVPGGTIREGSEPRHTVLRRLHTRALTPGVVRSWEPTITQRVASHLTTMALDAPDRGVDPRPHVREMVLATWSDLLLGIPPEDPAYDEVSTLVSDLDPDRHIYARALPDDEVLRNLDRFAALLVNAQRERGRFRDCPSMAMRFEETEPGALTDPGTVRNVIYETINTRDDMAGLLMWVLKFLADDPAWLARLRAADGDEVGLADRIVSETLRLAQSEYIFRRAVREIRFGGVVIPATWAVRVCIHEIHRDPEKFDHADRFDPDRFRDDGCGRELYAPFGIDHHSCVGESLARTMARIFVTELARGFDAETIRDGPVELTIERHWAPSSRWRVALRTRTTAGAGVEDRA